MRQRKRIAIVIALLWVVVASPYLASALFLSHGDHRVSAEIKAGTLTLVYHHDGELADHHHSDSSGAESESNIPESNQDHSDDQSENSEDHVTSLYATVATSLASIAPPTVKLLSDISLTVAFAALTQISSFEVPKIHCGSVDGVPISTLCRRTTVLLI